MPLKKLGNTSEYKTRAILESVLKGSNFHVYPELAVSKVIDLDSRQLETKERKTLNSSSFDFVIYNPESIPEFAVEFDGPHHKTDERARQSDIRKNRLCAMAGLRLLRIDDEFLNEYEKISLLEFIVRRFVDWKNDSEKIAEDEADIGRYLAAKNADEEEYEQMRDPQIMWDLFHPFPASITIAEELYRNYGIVSSHIDVDLYSTATAASRFIIFQRNRMGDESVGLYERRLRRQYELTEMIRDDSGRYKSENIHSLWVGKDYQFSLPHVDVDRSDGHQAALHI